MVWREQPNADAASGDVSPTVMEGMICCRNGDSGGIRLIMLTVLVPIAFMIFDVERVGEGGMFERVGEGGMFSYLRIYTYTHMHMHTHTFAHAYIHTYTKYT